MPPVVPPAGTSLAGFFVPQTFADPGKPPGILADPIDPATGDYLSIERGFDPTDGTVLTALRTVRGTGAAVTDIGQRYQEMQLVDERSSSFVDQETRRALKPLVDGGQISLTSRSLAVPGNDWAEAHVEYTNLARNNDRAAPIGGLL